MKQILFLTDGHSSSASCRMRAVQYIPLLNKYQFQSFHIPRLPHSTSNKFLKLLFPFFKFFYKYKRLIFIYLFKIDVIFIQRVFLTESILKFIKKKKTKIIFDFDDAIYINPQRKSDEFNTRLMIRYADEVIVSTPFLEEFCLKENKKPHIIPTPVDTTKIFPLEKQQNDKIIIGWIGSPWTCDFIKLIEDTLLQLYQKYPIQLLTIGAKEDFNINYLEHNKYKWNYSNENNLLSLIDIGIMPLPDNEFTQSKGGYKILQYMAAGLPTVASPVGINNKIIQHGVNGFLAKDKQEWFNYLEILINEKKMRKEFGESGRNLIVQEYSTEVCFSKLLEII